MICLFEKTNHEGFPCSFCLNNLISSHTIISMKAWSLVADAIEIDSDAKSINFYSHATNQYFWMQANEGVDDSSLTWIERDDQAYGGPGGVSRLLLSDKSLLLELSENSAKNVGGFNEILIQFDFDDVEIELSHLRSLLPIIFPGVNFIDQSGLTNHRTSSSPRKEDDSIWAENVLKKLVENNLIEFDDEKIVLKEFSRLLVLRGDAAMSSYEEAEELANAISELSSVNEIYASADELRDVLFLTSGLEPKRP